ncbi:histidine kinase [Roseobacter denitrificans]|uniref:Hpt domain protein n=1 Tax=Roseobacter denitrificans (strain ATCC 33942 / OCh 114) TaxID=375451 RepID=Q16D13_ROSDO|nr:Hpt domain-containing protein [Roseobacter denitrificans]ABG30130.1 Hpt domain protein [Roseobacter denitrificans OCh 114]AVL53323.1 histidine kinase [Roseobacter denitrificans]SFF69884.1 Hpt domain-containing protein [Roseobacter denitrificans OCh 114]
MIDWDRVAALREEVGAEDFDEVVELFLQEVDEEIETLAAQPVQDGLSEKLHFLKGSALSLGFRAFSDLCQTGEAALAQDPAASVDVEELQNSYQSSRSSFLNDLPTKFAC